MPGLSKIPGSIRTDGHASLGVSKPTRDRINRLAREADMPVSDYIKKLAEKAAVGKPATKAAMTAIIEQLVEKNESMAAEMKALRESYSKIELLVSDLYRKAGGKKPIDTGIRKAIRKMSTPSKTKLEKGEAGA